MSTSNVIAIPAGISPVSADTVSALERMLEGARAGTITGLAVVALQSKSNFKLELCGSAVDEGNHMSVAGMLAALQKMVLALED